MLNLADAQARLSDLVDPVEAGDAIEIRRRGRTVAKLSPPTSARKPFDVGALAALAGSTPLGGSRTRPPRWPE